jgi:drug/metabolite transporter (DMT)-like permease
LWSTGAHPLSGRAVYGLLWATILILGVNWPLNAIALRSVSPLWFTVLRVGGAAVIFSVLGVATGRLRIPSRGDWPVVLSVGVVGTAGVYGFVFTALQFVPPGRSSVLVWTAGLWAVPIAAFVLRERLSLLAWAGLAVGIAGIVMLFEPWRFRWSDHDVLVGHGLLVVAAILQAAVAVHVRGHRWRSSPADLLAWQLLVAVGVLAVAAALKEGWPVVRWSWPFGGNLAFQAVLASGFATWAKQMALQRLPATSMTLTMMAVPVVGLISSVVVLGESVTLAGMLGVVAVIAGVAASVAAGAKGAEIVP